MYIVILYIDHSGAKRFATVENTPEQIDEMRKRLTDAGFKLI